MSYRKKARDFIAKILTPHQRPKKYDSENKINQAAEEIPVFMNSDILTALRDFLGEYCSNLKTEFGFLYDPLPDQPDIHPLLQASDNPRSQYYAAKVKVNSYGWVFIIPLADPPATYCIVVKPARELRGFFRAKGVVIDGQEVSYIFPPYDDLPVDLFGWAVAIEAFNLFERKE